jgi:hypothetical protein
LRREVQSIQTVLPIFSRASSTLLTIAPTARRGAVWRYLSQLLTDAAAGRASMAEVEEVLLRGLNSERMI